MGKKKLTEGQLAPWSNCDPSRYMYMRLVQYIDTYIFKKKAWRRVCLTFLPC